MADEARARPALKILVFSTETISDPGIDFAGSSHLHYSPAVFVLQVPCSSGIRAEWVLAALERGFDGVFIAADGSDCAYVPDCTRRTGALIERAQNLLREHDQDPRRLKMAAVCSVCAESFVRHMRGFEKELMALDGKGGGPVAAA
jgi:F420-non-reducing hydrogenase iron-sulfur subunit